MGKGKHVRFTVESGGARARGVRLRRAARVCRSPRASRREATFTLEINEWSGVSEPRLVLRQARAREQLVAEPVAAPAAPVEDGELVLFA